MNRARIVFAQIRPALGNLLLAAGSIGLTFLVAEVGVRVVSPQQLITARPDIWQPAEDLGWIARPNVDTQINTGERTVRVQTDAMGFRIGSKGRIDGDREILLIGDSFMQALQVEHEQSTAGLLESELSKAMGLQVAVRNAGVDGWDPPQYVLRGKSLLVGGSYDLVLVGMYVGNDVVAQRPTDIQPRVPVAESRIRLPRSLSPEELVESLLRPTNNVLEERSHLFVLMKNRLPVLRMRLGLSPAYFPPIFLRAEAGQARWSVTTQLAVELAAAARESGSPILFFLIPTDYQVNPEFFDQYVLGMGLDTASVDLEQPNRILESRFTEMGLEVVDTYAALREARERGVRVNGSVDRHLSPDGHEALVDAILPKVLGMLK